MHDTDAEDDQNYPPITELTKAQRRVLGVLVEKAFTTPEYYPLTLKAITTGCNQKSNRSPTVSYSEDETVDVLEELRALGLAAVVHTESGRTERYRHYMRRRFSFSEPQLAILTELLLRGRQTLGELRARASRMVPIENLDDLRSELRGLQELNYIQASGSLERRGIEVDHNLYRPKEGQTLAMSDEDDSPARPQLAVQTTSAAATPAAPRAPQPQSAAPAIHHPEPSVLASTIEQLQMDNRELRELIDGLKGEIRDLSENFEDLRRDLGG